MIARQYTTVRLQTVLEIEFDIYDDELQDGDDLETAAWELSGNYYKWDEVDSSFDLVGRGEA